MKTPMKMHVKILKYWLASAFLFSWLSSAQAADLSLSTAPLYLGTAVDPNVFFLLDDSGSMDWSVLTVAHNRYNQYWEDIYDYYDSNYRVTSGNWYSLVSSEVCFRRRGCRTSVGDENIYYMYTNPDNLYESFGDATPETDPETAIVDWRGLSSDFNVLYYNPETDYEPWVGLSDATFTNVDSNPQPGSNGYGENKDLTGFTYYVWEDSHGYSGSYPDGPSDITDGANGEVDLWDNRTRYVVGSSSIAITSYTTASATTVISLGNNCDYSDATDTIPYENCYGTSESNSTVSGVNEWGRTLAQEKQNIANWYEFYRKRSYVAKAAISHVMGDQKNFRYGMTVTENWDSFFVEVPDSSVTDYTAHNANMLDTLYTYQWPRQSTPLRTGLEVAGKYYDAALSGKSDPYISQCQQSFTILFTDGYWNGGNPSYSISDADGDGVSLTLADVAKYYYDKDLSPLTDNVPASAIDPNTAQHMVTFGVAYGVKGNLVDTNADGYPDPELAEDGDWGNPFYNSLAKIDDLWHAAYNSKGLYIEAKYPAEVTDAITDTLSEIADRVGSSASVATNSGSLEAGSHLFQARFDSDKWSGQLLAFALNADGTLQPDPDWDARDELESLDYNSGREIITYNPTANSGAGAGIPFRFPTDYQSPDADSDLNATQLAALMTNAPNSFGTANASEKTANQTYGQNLLNYLRGDRSNEGSSASKFRERNYKLGDIVDSDPQFVGAPRERYPDALEAKPYSTFKSTYSSRASMVYVGANDGMLHGFRESDGTELMAYVPSKLYSTLYELGNQDYSHRYYVNEAPTIVDVYMSGKYDAVSASNGSWRSALVGSLGGGGQGLFALDVTNPANFDESNAADLVLWEFTDEDDADMGYSYSVPSVFKMADGSWAAIFGNGYNNTDADGHASTTGHAVLYVVDIEDGSILRKIDTGAGSTGTPNGLATPALIDVDSDNVVDYAYAGDLQGNMWKFDFTSSTPANWDVAWESGGTPQPLFTTATDQPITTRPAVAYHPDNLGGFMVYFGTGKYLETFDDDAVGAPTQSFYGVWDKNESTLTPFTRSNLLEQTIDNQYSKGYDLNDDMVDDTFYNLRDVSDNAIDFTTDMGWYIDLYPQKIEGVANTNNFGERQVSNALVRDGRVIFTTLLPSQGLCDFGGSSFPMQVSYRTGGALNFPAFDLNGDGVFDDSDTLASGKQSDVGIVPTLSILLDNDTEIAYGSGSSGAIDVIQLNPGALAFGRQSWRQLR